MGQPPSFPWGKLPRAAADEEADRKSAPQSFVSPPLSAPSARELPAKPAEGESASKTVHLLSSTPLSLCRPRGGTSLTEGGGNKRASACKFAAFRLFCRCGGTFPVGKVGVARLRRSMVGARHSRTHRSHAARAERGSACGIRLARICRHLRRQRVQGEGRLREKPLSLACSFLAIFLHEQKGGAPGGRNPRPIKRAAALQTFGFRLFCRCGGTFPVGKVGIACKPSAFPSSAALPFPEGRQGMCRGGT
jgi:hypothetical protein